MKHLHLFLLMFLVYWIYYLKPFNPFLSGGVLFVTLFLLVKCNRKMIESFQTMKNIYGETLQPCRKYPNDMSGSWDQQGYCSELGGGVHQICFDVTKQTQDFASDTYQGVNWSKDRLGKNHCMCLGAWALYKARQTSNQLSKTKNELKCESIPEVSLTKGYIDTWNTWNGNELPNQVVNGVNELVKQCHQKANTKQKQYLKKIYKNLIKGKKEFPKSII